MLVETGISYAQRETYPLSGLEGTLWQLPTIGVNVGLSSIADFQITGGPYNRPSITSRRSAPLASLVSANDQTTHDVDDLTVATKIRLMSETARRPAVGVRFSVRLPNAKHASGLGQDTTDFSATALTGTTLAGVRVVGNVGVTIMSEPLDAMKQNDLVIYGLSFGRALPGHVELVADLNGRWSTRPGIAPVGTETRGVMTLGGRYRPRGPVRWDAAAFWGLTSVGPTFGLTAGVTYLFRAFALP